MDAIKFKEHDTMAVAPGCFDLPICQAVDLCSTCHASSVKGPEPCPQCGDNGYTAIRIVSRWMFTDDEWAFMVANPEARGVYLHVMAVQTPPVLVDMGDPFLKWPDIVPVKRLKLNDKGQVIGILPEEKERPTLALVKD